MPTVYREFRVQIGLLTGLISDADKVEFVDPAHVNLTAQLRNQLAKVHCEFGATLENILEIDEAIEQVRKQVPTVHTPHHIYHTPHHINHTPLTLRCVVWQHKKSIAINANDPDPHEFMGNCLVTKVGPRPVLE